MTNEELEVALSTQLLNDKLIIDGNIGVGGSAIGSSTGTTQQNTSNIVGDVNVEYKVTSKFRVKAFNRSNRYDYLRQNAPYTQGVGIFYRREFDKWNELFFPKRDNKSKPIQ